MSDRIKLRDAVTLILSIGYEKTETKAFLKTLSSHNIQAVVDVRESAFSRRLDFRKNKLVAILEDEGIEYVHLKIAGNPYRKASEDSRGALGMYRDYISTEPKLMEQIADEFESIGSRFSRIAVLCYEKEPDDCHRTILLNRLVSGNEDYSLIEV